VRLLWITSGRHYDRGLIKFRQDHKVCKGLEVDIRVYGTDVITKGYHDPCAGIRAVPIGEAMAALW